MVKLETSYAFRCQLVLKARTAKDTTLLAARAWSFKHVLCVVHAQSVQYAYSICKFEGTDRNHEMRHKHSELREKSQIALQVTAEKVARGMDG